MRFTLVGRPCLVSGWNPRKRRSLFSNSQTRYSILTDVEVLCTHAGQSSSDCFSRARSTAAAAEMFSFFCFGRAGALGALAGGS